MECCLCKSDILTSKKRKKLHGAKCLAAREALVNEMEGLTLKDFVQTGADAYICHHCDKLLTGISTLHAKLSKAKEDVSKMVNSLQKRKRPSEMLLPGSPAKQVCLASASQEQQQSMATASATSQPVLAHLPMAVDADLPTLIVSEIAW